MTYPSGPAQGPGGSQGQQPGGPGTQQPGQAFGAPGQGAAQPAQGAAAPGTQQLHPVAPKRPNPLAGIGVEKILPVVVLVLALVGYFISFSGYAGAVSMQIYLLLAGGLLSAMSVMPKAPAAVLPVGVVLSVVGGLGMLAAVVRAGAVTTSIILILVFGVLQLLVAVGAYLADVGVLKLPVPGSGMPHQRGWAPAAPAQQQAPQQSAPQQGPPQQGPPQQQAGGAGFFAGQQTVQQPLPGQQASPAQDLFSGEQRQDGV